MKHNIETHGDRMTKCQECGKDCLGEQEFMKHNIETHGEFAEQMYWMDDDFLEEIVLEEVHQQDASLEEENNLLEERTTERENPTEKSPDKEQNPKVELVLVKYLKRQWPAKVIERKKW